MIVLLAASGLSILALPHLLRIVGRQLQPRLWSALCASALAGGTVLVIGSGLLASLSTVMLVAGESALAHACDVMFGRLVTSGSPLAFIVLGVTASAVFLSGKAVRSGRRSARTAWVEPGIGERLVRDGQFEFIILQNHRAHAVSVPGTIRHSPQIILTSGLIAALSASELELVCAHEESHIRLRHHRQLILAMAVERSMWFWPCAAESTRALRLALERAADEEAAGGEPQSRSRLRSALLAVAVDGDAAVLAAFSPLDGLIERVTAMEQPRPRTLSPIWWCPLFLPGLVIGAAALFAANRLGHSAYCLLTMPGSCRLR